VQGLSGLNLPEPRTEAGRAGLTALLARPARALIALDYDGTLAPIVADPAEARPHPAALPVLRRVAEGFGFLALVTGRPAAVVVELAGLAEAPGLDRLVVFGRYGAERWEAGATSVHGPAPHPGVASAREELFRVVESVRARVGPPAEGVVVEDKGASLAVHTRRARDPDATLGALRGPIAALAGRHGLRLEPGRHVLELRPAGVDKGSALLVHAAECGAAAVLYAGDDLGDLAAFDAVEILRTAGVAGVTVAVASAEASAPEGRADVVVDGPPGLLALLGALSDLVR
jgi:trehalose 6-phosphate phosphatase